MTQSAGVNSPEDVLQRSAKTAGRFQAQATQSIPFRLPLNRLIYKLNYIIQISIAL